MAVDKPISELNPAGELSGSEPVAIVQNGETVRTTTEEIANKGTAFMVSNEVYTLEVQNADLSGTGSIESQLVAYILALPTLQRTILKTQSKWNVRLLNGAQLLSVHEIVGKGIGVISTLGVANLQLIYEDTPQGIANNEVFVLEINESDLSGTGTIEEQICEYILALPPNDRTILNTQSKWNVKIVETPYTRIHSVQFSQEFN